MDKTIIARVAKKAHVNDLCYRLLKGFASKSKSSLSTAEARSILMEACPKPDGTVIAENSINPEYDLQIIIPVYNAEEWINRCIDSVLMQKCDYKIICCVVDDGSKDNSGKIVDEYKDNEMIRIIHQENGGLAAARNVVLKNMCARYVMFLDNDDYLPENCLKALLDAAYKNDADIVEGSVINEVNGKRLYETKKDEVTDYRSLRGQAWSKIYRSELFKNLCFPKGYWFEDTTLSYLIYPVLKKVVTVSDYVYIHTLNRKGMVETVKGKPRSIESYWGSEYLDEVRNDLNYPNDKDYFERLKGQFLINHRRCNGLDEKIKEAIFVLESEMLSKRFPDREYDDEMMNYVYDLDYNSFEKYAFWH